MTCRVRLISAAGLCACVVGVMGAATAAKAYDAEYVFGDSLSDNGNAAELGGADYPDPPSYHDAYTNGPVAVAVLAKSLGLPALEPSLWANNFTDEHNLFASRFHAWNELRLCRRDREPGSGIQIFRWPTCRSRSPPIPRTSATLRTHRPCMSS